MRLEVELDEVEMMMESGKRSMLALTGMVVMGKGWVRFGVQERNPEGQMVVE